MGMVSWSSGADMVPAFSEAVIGGMAGSTGLGAQMSDRPVVTAAATTANGGVRDADARGHRPRARGCATWFSVHQR